MIRKGVCRRPRCRGTHNFQLVEACGGVVVRAHGAIVVALEQIAVVGDEVAICLRRGRGGRMLGGLRGDADGMVPRTGQILTCTRVHGRTTSQKVVLQGLRGDLRVFPRYLMLWGLLGS